MINVCAVHVAMVARRCDASAVVRVRLAASDRALCLRMRNGCCSTTWACVSRRQSFHSGKRAHLQRTVRGYGGWVGASLLQPLPTSMLIDDDAPPTDISNRSGAVPAHYACDMTAVRRTAIGQSGIAPRACGFGRFFFGPAPHERTLTRRRAARLPAPFAPSLCRGVRPLCHLMFSRKLALRRHTRVRPMA